jgi:quinol monooxygenase YgiN
MKNLGLLATIIAKPDKTEVVAKFLEDAVELSNKENQTLSWYSFRINKDTFGIFDTFNDDSGREAHLNGEIAKALMGRTDELLINTPDIQKVDILSSK